MNKDLPEQQDEQPTVQEQMAQAPPPTAPPPQPWQKEENAHREIKQEEGVTARFNPEELKLIINALSKDEDVALADRVNLGAKKMEMLENFMKLHDMATKQD